MDRNASADALLEALPYSKEAEQSVLGSVLIEPELLGEIMERIKSPSVFYTRQHQALYGLMLQMFSESRPIDFVTLLDEIKGPMQEKGILFGYEEDAARLIAKKSFGDRSGGRAIRRTIRREVEDRIAELLVERAGDPPAMLKVTAEGDEIRLTYA